MGEEGHNFLDVMCHQNERGRVSALGERGEEFQEVFARDGVEAGGGFVEKEHAQARHQGAADEHALTFALREHPPRSLGEMAGTYLSQDARGLLFLRGGDAAPKIDLRVVAGEYDFPRGLIGFDLVAEAGADQADGLPHLAPIVSAEAGRADPDFAAGGHEVSGQCAEERGFAGAIGAQNDPVLPALHAPVDLVQNDGLALDAQLFHFEDGLRDHSFP